MCNLNNMKHIQIITFLLAIFCLIGCSGDALEEKGFSVSQGTEEESDPVTDGLNQDSLTLKTRPSKVLLTGIPEFRLTTVYKVNYTKKDKKSFIGSDYYYRSYTDLGDSPGNQWHYNFMLGLEAVYGYNMVNVSHYNSKTQQQKDLFAAPVLIKTLYYPSFSSDTLNFKPVNRDYYLVSVYDEDTNKDGFISEKGLRRFYHFDIHAENKKPLVPKEYSVLSSEYDSANDFMYVFAQLDTNKNGKRDEGEDIHIFWIDLNNPEYTGKQY